MEYWKDGRQVLRIGDGAAGGGDENGGVTEGRLRSYPLPPCFIHFSPPPPPRILRKYSSSETG